MEKTMIETLKEKMRKGYVTFVYLKKDGSKRTATGTLNVGIIAEANATPVGNGSYDESTTTRYFDKDANAWRSFVNDNLESIQ